MIQAAIRSRKCDFFWTVEKGGVRLGEERKAEPKRKVSWHYSCKWAWRDPFLTRYLDWLCSSNVIFSGVDLKSASERRTGIERPRGSERVSSGKSLPQSWLFYAGQESILLRSGTSSNACVSWNQAVSVYYSVLGFESDVTLYFCLNSIYRPFYILYWGSFCLIITQRAYCKTTWELFDLKPNAIKYLI